ncbi:hypothetical protein SARC_01434 [Sphaeroforma arctica JP610]|uniref:Uncharacterized protein n=1 Tax=Sphaeroforma arctica JP610 TaxID=667725 RepID=A0A0L0GDT6_9EUKA|nr:hypothetical protein SARC_01434 [Sphaeroforma arctica JP610]KNC86428.1 hypothetical protein SARC_01434 [Sphaeroforma arctica JP610]|eukprot:XP_014160330.1 hypothetical protein SARC_01434 [Sphaeroforma arctica JP610]
MGLAGPGFPTYTPSPRTPELVANAEVHESILPQLRADPLAVGAEPQLEGQAGLLRAIPGYVDDQFTNAFLVNWTARFPVRETYAEWETAGCRRLLQRVSEPRHKLRTALTYLENNTDVTIVAVGHVKGNTNFVETQIQRGVWSGVMTHPSLEWFQVWNARLNSTETVTLAPPAEGHTERDATQGQDIPTTDFKTVNSNHTSRCQVGVMRVHNAVVDTRAGRTVAVPQASAPNPSLVRGKLQRKSAAQSEPKIVGDRKVKTTTLGHIIKQFMQEHTLRTEAMGISMENENGNDKILQVPEGEPEEDSRVASESVYQPGSYGQGVERGRLTILALHMQGSPKANMKYFLQWKELSAVKPQVIAIDWHKMGEDVKCEVVKHLLAHGYSDMDVTSTDFWAVHDDVDLVAMSDTQPSEG